MNHLPNRLLWESAISMFVLLCVAPVASQASMTWQDPVLVSTNVTDFPGVGPVLSYAPNGDLRIFYCAGKQTNDFLASRLKRQGETEFGKETLVHTQARSVGVHYAENYTVDVAVAQAPAVSIRRSSNYGHNYSTRYGYPGARNWPTAPNYMPSFFAEDGDELRLAYTYREFNAVLGSSVEVCTARRTGDTWDADEVNLGDIFGKSQAVGIHEMGDQVCIAAGNGILYSDDNGTNFSLIDNGVLIPEELKAVDMAVDTNRIYILRGYTFGPGTTNQHMVFTYSDDCGTNWQSPQKDIVVAVSNYMFYPCFTVEGDRMVVIWEHSEVANEHAFIRCIISEDQGETWGPIHTAVALTGGDLLAFNGYPAIDIVSGKDRVTLGYVLYDGGSDYAYYTAELIIDSDDDGLADWAEDDEGTDANIPDSDSDGQSDGDEVVARVDALDAESVFAVTEVAYSGDGDLSVEWDGLLGCLYTVQTRTDLGSGNWTNAPGVTNVPGKGVKMVFTNQAGPSLLFCRVKVDTRTAPEGMVFIPRGNFEMGDHYGLGNANELPVHTNTINAFYMDSYEVTGVLWSNVYVWATNNGYGFEHPGIADGSNFPIAAVSWYDSVKWCNARSEKGGLVPAYYTDSGQGTPYRSGELALTGDCVKWDADGYRLPTEAEWEKAARGGLTGHHYPWEGSGGICSNHIDDSYANFMYSNDSYEDEAGGADTTPVGYYNWEQWPRGPDRANGYGLYDMAGNVLEWCWDRYQSDWYSQPGQTNNPRGPDTGSSRTRRGGHWDNYWLVYLRCAARASFLPSFALDQECGLRCVRSN